jgi:hypothetical protein
VVLWGVRVGLGGWRVGEQGHGSLHRVHEDAAHGDVDVLDLDQDAA